MQYESPRPKGAGKELVTLALIVTMIACTAAFVAMLVLDTVTPWLDDITEVLDLDPNPEEITHLIEVFEEP